MSLNPDTMNKPPEPGQSVLVSAAMEPGKPVGSGQLQQQATAQLHPVGKHQMLPLVVIQANQKLSTAVSNSNVITIPQMQVNNQMMLGKAPIMLQKASSLPKNGVTFVTMLKPVSKPPDSVLSATRMPITNISKFKTESFNNLQVLNNQKIMITPMPSVTSNRLPVTMTTNSVQSKISFRPLQAQKKILNFKIADGSIVNAVKKEDVKKYVDLSTKADLTITAVPDDRKKAVIPVTQAAPPVANDERSYELSIVEDDAEEKSVQHGVSILKRNLPFGKLYDKPVQDTPLLNNTTATPIFASMPPLTIPQHYKEPAVSCLNDTIITISDPTTKEVHIRKSDTVKPPDVPPPPPPLPPPALPVLTTLPVAPPLVMPPLTPQEPTKVDIGVAEIGVSTPTSGLPPTKRSRKSTLCLRKDFHDIELQVSSKCKTLKKLDLEEEKKSDLEVDAINSGGDPFNFSSLLDEEFCKLFDWKHSVGKLPGSNLKFFVNEFGFLEYLTQDEYNKISQGKKRAAKDDDKPTKRRVKKELTPEEEQEEMRCLECGCFGMVSEFINPKYCSLDCHAAGEKKAVNQAGKKKRSFGNTQASPQNTNSTTASTQKDSNHSGFKKRRLENGDSGISMSIKELRESSDDDASVRTDNSHDKYPWHCKTKGFSWSKYLAHINAIGAPVKLFKDAFPYNRNGFRPGMKLEGIDPSHPSYFCVMTVAQVQGFRLQLHFDGYPKNYDFWVNADSMDIFPAGFCEKHDHVLHPPPNFPDFTWGSYLKHTKASVAPKHLFTNRTGSAIFPTAFRVGMKLEAVDRKNTSLVCVATAKDLMDSRILVHFDSWDDIYDYWADPSSPYIHPVGWCDKNGHNLTPPNDYPDPENFTWEKYLKEANAVAAPVRAFKQRPPSGFRKGMRLECVDKRVPQYVRVACVVEVKNHRLRIAFDGWPDRYSYWLDDDSSDIHPVGWCQKTGHPLEPPLTPEDVYDFIDCATIGCRGVGHMKGPVFGTHTSLKYCPYAEENIDVESFLPDRLQSPDRELEAVVPVSREPRSKKLPSWKKKKYETNASKTEWIDGEDLAPDTNERDNTSDRDEPKEDFKIKSSTSTPVLSPSPPASIKKERLSPEVSEEPLNVDELNMRSKHSKYFKAYAKCKTDPSAWTTGNVRDYVQTLPFAKHNADAFTQHVIDGESFLMLTQEDLVEVLKYKLGPAIALYNCILLLRKNAICAT